MAEERSERLGGSMTTHWIDKWWFGRDPLLGLDFTESEILASCKGAVTGDRRIVSFSGLMPPGAFHDHRIHKPKELGSAIRHTLSEKGYDFDRCGVALAPTLFFMRAIDIRSAPPSLDRDGITAWALESFKLDSSELVARVLIYEEQELPLLVAVRREVVESYQRTMECACLDLDLITLRPEVLLSAAKKWMGGDCQTDSLLVYLGKNGGEVCRVRNMGVREMSGAFHSNSGAVEMIERALRGLRAGPGDSSSGGRSPVNVLFCCEPCPEVLGTRFEEWIGGWSNHHRGEAIVTTVIPSVGSSSLVAEAIAESL
jgi:hypothetical protein